MRSRAESCGHRRKRGSSSNDGSERIPKGRIQVDGQDAPRRNRDGIGHSSPHTKRHCTRCLCRRSTLCAVAVAAALAATARHGKGAALRRRSTSKGYPRKLGIQPDSGFDNDYLAALRSGGRTVEYQEPPRRRYRTIEGGHEPFEKGNCVAMREWQRGNHPTCNSVHEMDIGNEYDQGGGDHIAEIINNGWYRLVWKVPEFDGLKRVLKTLLYKHEFEPSIIELHRRDSVAVDHLTRSPHIMNIHGFCTTSGLYDYSHGGDLKVAVRSGLTPRKKLEISWQVASAVADAQDMDGEGMATVALRDVSSSQFILDPKDDIFKLTDFNMAVFMTWDRDTHEPCTFSEGSTADIVRSPEEYSHSQNLTEKVDSYSLGDVLHFILRGHYPFRSEGHSTKTIKRYVTEGRRPRSFDDIIADNDPTELTILKAVLMTRSTNPKMRSSVRDVETYLKDQLSEF